MAEISILVVEDDTPSQRAIRDVLDAEGCHVRIVSTQQVLPELARGGWNLVIVNAALTDPRGPLFAILRDLTLADSEPGADDVADEEIADISGADRVIVERSAAPKRAGQGIRVLFLVPSSVSKHMQPVLEREGLPYALKPYNLHDFLEKVSDLLLEAGAIDAPIRSIRDLAPRKRPTIRKVRRSDRNTGMFAPREDYQMTEEEMAEWERQDETEIKKRRKEQEDREHLG
ncbi:MAG TPA: hypothetical protein VFW94_08380 [Candidatus Acidoferrales bacterium]|nr:hypothetical protein [Candidatus Acidoferrales bacterium]